MQTSDHAAPGLMVFEKNLRRRLPALVIVTTSQRNGRVRDPGRRRGHRADIDHEPVRPPLASRPERDPAKSYPAKPDNFSMRLFNVAALCVACGLALAACGKKQPPPMPPPTVGYIVLRTEPVTLTTELPGRVSAMESSDVRPQISGVVRRRDFVEGSMVHAGQGIWPTSPTSRFATPRKGLD